MEPRLNSNSRINILWAVDAFEDPEILMKTAQFLVRLGASTHLSIEPVYVLSPEQLSLPVDFDELFLDRYVPAGKKALAGKIRELQVPGALEPRILTHPSPSLRGAVNTLNRYAAQSRPDLIVLGSHGRRGMDRAMLGSFAEQLLLTSEVPVVVVGSKALSKERAIRTFLFPTDFGDSAEAHFREILPLAKALGVKIVLLHSTPKLLKPVFESGIQLISGAWVPDSACRAEPAESRQGRRVEARGRAFRSDAGDAVRLRRAERDGVHTSRGSRSRR